MQNALSVVGRSGIRTQQSEHCREASPVLIQVRNFAVTTVTLKSYSLNLVGTIIERKFESLGYRRLICSQVFLWAYSAQVRRKRSPQAACDGTKELARPWTSIVSMIAAPPARRAAKKCLAAARIAEGERPWNARQLITTSKTPGGGQATKSCSAPQNGPNFRWVGCPRRRTTTPQTCSVAPTQQNVAAREQRLARSPLPLPCNRRRA